MLKSSRAVRRCDACAFGGNLSRRLTTYALQVDGRSVAALSKPRHPLHASLPEVRACFVEALPVRVSQRFSKGELDDHDGVYQSLFETLRNDQLAELTAYSNPEVVPSPGDRWCEYYLPVAPDDTLFVGLRADVKYDRAEEGVFEHRYIAWSKASDQVAAQGGATIRCTRDAGDACAIPPRWVHRMEVDYGEAWASVKILEFRREAGLGSNFGTNALEDDLK